MSGPNCVRCPFVDCGFRADTSVIVKHHIKTEHAEDDNESKDKDYRFLCGGCAKSFGRSKFFGHLRSCERKVDVLVNRNHKRPFSAVDGDEYEASGATVGGVRGDASGATNDDVMGEASGAKVDDVRGEASGATVDDVRGEASGATVDDVRGEASGATAHEDIAHEDRQDECYANQVTTIIDKDYLNFATSNILSLKVVCESINISNTLNKHSIDHAQHIFRRLLTKHMSDDPAKLQQIIKDLPASMRPVREPLRLINSPYYLEQYFKALPTFVQHVFVSFMKSENTERYTGEDVFNPDSDTQTQPLISRLCGFLFVPIGESLSCLFTSNPELVHCIQRPSPTPPRVYSRAVDGSNCRRNALLNDPRITTVALCLTFDDVEVATKGHVKETLYQVSVMNMPSYYSSAIEGLTLVAQGSSANFNAAYREPGETTKTTGTNLFLRFLSERFQQLEQHGFSYVVNGETKRMFATLVAVVADNLATHQVYSYAAGFANLNYPCIICKIHKNMIGTQYSEFVSRNDDENELWAEKVKQAYEQSKGAGATMTALSGQKGVCDLRTPFWTIAGNTTIDIMHDVDYGPVQFGTIALVRYADISDELDQFTIERLNERIKNDVKFGRSDSRHSFTHINAQLSLKNPKHIKFDDIRGDLIEAVTAAATGLKAAQGYVFLKLIDQLISPEMIPRTELVWKHFMRLRAIVMATHSTSISEVELVEFTFCYELMIQGLWIQHFTNNKYPINRPKNHYMAHYPCATRANGPPMAISTYAGERSLGYTTKQVDASGNSSVNMTKSSADRRQFRQAVKLNNKSVQKDVYRTELSLKPADRCLFSEGIQLLRDKEGDDVLDWFWVKYFSFRGTRILHCCYMLLTEPVDDNVMPRIVKVLGVFMRSVLETNAWVLVQNMKVNGPVGNRCYGSFVINKTPGNFELICLRSCEDHHPMDGYPHWASSENNFINPGMLRVYTHSNSRWLSRKNINAPF